MTTPFRLLPEKTRVGAIVSVNKLEGSEDDREFIHRELRDRLVPQVADLVAQRAVRTDHRVSTDYRIDLYVLTPDQLAELIQREAIRIAHIMKG